MKRAILIFVTATFVISCSDLFVDNQYKRKEAEQEIRVLYKYGFKSEVNTFNKTLTKDLVWDGTVTIDFWFQPEEQKKIIEKIDEIDFWSLRDTLNQNPEDSIRVEVSPNPGIQTLKIEYEKKTKAVYWYVVNDYPAEYNRLLKLTKTLKEIVNNDPEYKNLPPARGGYN